MWQDDQYQLLDFGDGRKLERFGKLILDRPSPAAEHADVADRAMWAEADYRLDDQVPSAGEWSIQYDTIVFKLRLTPFGHVGLFPEHAQHWQWLRSLADSRLTSGHLLNLFAYTGGATLAMASVGWQVTHVDSSAPAVTWARENAELSGLNTAPIRWLTEDARLYAARELKRGRTYDAILLDPPSYGHGPKGKAWNIERDLVHLLELCCRLLAPGGALILTGHSYPEPINTNQLSLMLQQVHDSCVQTEAGRTEIRDLAGRALDFGWYVRAQA